MLNSRFAGIPISSSTIDGPGVPQLMNRGEQTLRAVTGSGGRLHLGMVAGFKSERRPTSNRNLRPDCLGIRNGRNASPSAIIRSRAASVFLDSRMGRGPGPVGALTQEFSQVLDPRLKMANDNDLVCSPPIPA
jgi:hypothetical protein